MIIASNLSNNKTAVNHKRLELFMDLCGHIKKFSCVGEIVRLTGCTDVAVMLAGYLVRVVLLLLKEHVCDFYVHRTRFFRINVACPGYFRADIVTPLNQHSAGHEFFANYRFCNNDGRITKEVIHSIYSPNDTTRYV